MLVLIPKGSITVYGVLEGFCGKRVVGFIQVNKGFTVLRERSISMTT